MARKTVAVIGGGVAGLSCARRLGELGVSATVFDTGKRGPGGRASSRLWRGHVVDHAAQYVAATDPDFSAWIAATGAMKRWGHDGRFGTLSKSGFTPIADGVERWVGLNQLGIGGIVQALQSKVDVRQDVWIPPSNGLHWEGDGIWSVCVPDGRGGKTRARFDTVVVAHNGKCAERLTSSTPAREVHTLLRTNFSATLPQRAAQGSAKFTLNQVYSLLFEVESGVMPSNFEGAFVQHEQCLRWLCSNSAKFRDSHTTDKDVEVWTALSSASFGKQHKVPQELLEGTEKETEATNLLLRAVERAAGLKDGVLLKSVRATKLQLWGAALPINRWASKDSADFVWSAAHQIGIAGDWLTSCPARASTIEAAWVSGKRLAEHIAGTGVNHNMGLQLGPDGGLFVPVDGDFGSGGVDAAGMWVAEPGEQDEEKGKGKRSKGGAKGGHGRDRYSTGGEDVAEKRWRSKGGYSTHDSSEKPYGKGAYAKGSKNGYAVHGKGRTK